MAYYRTCPDCGGNLDPGERCECQDERKTAPSAANTQSGMVENGLDGSISISHFTEE